MQIEISASHHFHAHHFSTSSKRATLAPASSQQEKASQPSTDSANLTPTQESKDAIGAPAANKENSSKAEKKGLLLGEQFILE